VYKSERHKFKAVVEDLKAARRPYEPLWRDIDPYYPGLLRLQLSEQDRGTRDDSLVINSTANKCFETFQNGMIAYGTNPSEPWVEIAPEDKDLAQYGPVANFCEDVAKDQLAIIEDAGMYEVFKSVFGYGGLYGNALMWMEERLDRVLYAQSMALGQWWIGKGPYGDPNTFYRELRLTVRQAVEKFGGDPRKPEWERFSQKVKSAWDRGSYGEPVDIGHLVMPNDAYDPRAVDAKNKAYKSCYWELDSDPDSAEGKKYLRESGYDDFPALFFPWESCGDDIYSISSPGIVSLGDNKELQHWAKKVAVALDKMVDPPLMGPSWAKMIKVGYFPGQITALQDTDLQRGGLRPLHDINAKVLEALERENKIEGRLKDAWHMDAFRYLDVIDHSKRTATEIAARQQQSMLQLVGAMNRINKGILNPCIERIFKYQLAQGRVGGPYGIPIPEELEGQKLKIRYVSRMAQAMRSVNIEGIDQILQTAVVIAKDGGNPNVWNTINIHELMYAKAKAMDVPSRIMRGPEEVAQMEAAQAQAQALQAQNERMMAIGKTVKDLGSTPTDEKTVLTDVASALGGQAA
jgi:hypothetical protein